MPGKEAGRGEVTGVGWGLTSPQDQPSTASEAGRGSGGTQDLGRPTRPRMHRPCPDTRGPVRGRPHPGPSPLVVTKTHRTAALCLLISTRSLDVT